MLLIIIKRFYRNIDKMSLVNKAETLVKALVMQYVPYILRLTESSILIEGAKKLEKLPKNFNYNEVHRILDDIRPSHHVAPFRFPVKYPCYAEVIISCAYEATLNYFLAINFEENMKIFKDMKWPGYKKFTVNGFLKKSIKAAIKGINYRPVLRDCCNQCNSLD